ncbi:MAG: endonuclease/exonuclease/phosphatase family protein [Verrucomicrobiota bacterium]
MRLLPFVVVLLLSVSTAAARSFSIVTYNVENLFDADGVALYDDYQPARYTPAHLSTKLQNISRVLARVNRGEGPDIIVFNEVELDQTPPAGGKPGDADAWLAAHADRRYDELLAGQPLPPDIAGTSSAVWLLKALSDHGMTGYTLITSDEQPGVYPGESRGRAIQNVILSRFPVKAVRNHPTQNARTIVEAELSVDGHTLHVFANHWKSGAGNVETEGDRIANAKTLRARVDRLLAADPNTDIVIAGDLNSHYNQRERYKAMRETGINTHLRAQGNELAIRGRDRDLYNLWFELPREQRRSDLFRGEWGTLMHLIVSRGLYDKRGVQYEDNSFAVMTLAGLNVDGYGQPNRWSFDGPAGSGFSDHFPLYARFNVVDDNRPDRWLALTKPSEEDDPVGDPLRVDYGMVDLTKAIRLADLPKDADLRDGTWSGKIFRVTGKAVDHRYVKVEFAGQVYDVFSHEKEIRDLLYEQRNEKGRLSFYGELGTYKGNWQFLVRAKNWVR